MLGHWKSHKEYQSFLLENVIHFFKSYKDSVIKYEKSLSKLYILDLDLLLPVLTPYYSVTGAPAKNQPEFILMSELKYHSLTKWTASRYYSKIC